jgi:2-methylcitrate dehydratase PrpD
MTILMKRFATHITAHTPVEAIRDLRDQYRFAPADIVAITIAGSKRMATVNNIPKPPDVLIAQYSIPFCVALALYRNPIDPASFDEKVAADPDILAMAARIRMEITPGQGNGDLASLSRRVTNFKGTPERPLAPADVKEKFQLLSKRFPRPAMDRLFERLQTLETEKTLDWLNV